MNKNDLRPLPADDVASLIGLKGFAPGFVGAYHLRSVTPRHFGYAIGENNQRRASANSDQASRERDFTTSPQERKVQPNYEKDCKLSRCF